MIISRSALVPFSAMEMYRLVQDVPAYPEFLRWCTEARIHEQGDDFQVASLAVSVAGIRQRFKTRNTLEPGQRLGMSLVEGPFSDLQGEWRFRSLGDTGSKVSLDLSFDFRPGLISSAFQAGFRGIADHLVQEFCLRAEQVFRAGTRHG